MKRTLIIGTDAFLVTTMRMALKFASDVTVVGVRDVGDAVRRSIAESRPDLVLLDGSDDVERTLDRIAIAGEECPDAFVLVVGGRPAAADLDRLLDADVTVCLSRALTVKSFDRLLVDAEPAPRHVAQPVAPAPVATRTGAVSEAPAVSAPPSPRQQLTARELEILRCVAEGHTNARIARDLWVTEQTVKFHLTNIYRKLGVSNRTEASRYVLLNDTRPAAPTAELHLEPAGSDRAYGALEAVN